MTSAAEEQCFHELLSMFPLVERGYLRQLIQQENCSTVRMCNLLMDTDYPKASSSSSYSSSSPNDNDCDVVVDLTSNNAEKQVRDLCAKKRSLSKIFEMFPDVDDAFVRQCVEEAKSNGVDVTSYVVEYLLENPGYPKKPKKKPVSKPVDDEEMENKDYYSTSSKPVSYCYRQNWYSSVVIFLYLILRLIFFFNFGFVFFFEFFFCNT